MADNYYGLVEELLPQGRLWLRITTTKTDDEILQSMAACLRDLENGGVLNLDTDDALVREAMKLFLRAKFGYNDDADKFAAAYEGLKASMAVSGRYGNGDQGTVAEGT